MQFIITGAIGNVDNEVGIDGIKDDVKPGI